jgi:hypothetical protein
MYLIVLFQATDRTSNSCFATISNVPNTMCVAHPADAFQKLGNAMGMK